MDGGKSTVARADGHLPVFPQIVEELDHVAGLQKPLAIAQCAEIAYIPVKKRSRPAMCYMDADEIAAVLREPDQSRARKDRGITRC